ncbi:hypothetical protein IFR04_005828 [Cadophora malorum]|uniref:Uncharacterized protein n=1 Tax=Cadophora malorum TaxID=108018 RepID=A0A8H7TG76_9HELO|nr:hypothetical protein IFR04_005828 [Cadophora malorum]
MSRTGGAAGWYGTETIYGGMDTLLITGTTQLCVLLEIPYEDGRLLLCRGTTFEQTMLEFHPLPKSAVALSTVGARRYGLVLVLDTATNKNVVLDIQGDSRNNDPFFGRFKFYKVPPKYKIHKIPFYGEEGVHARLAPDLLRDFIHLTSHLKPGFLPGSVRTDEDYTPELTPPKWENWVRTLYHDYGWPTEEPLEDCQFLSLRRNNTSITVRWTVSKLNFSIKQ